ncbi:uncharacterized protein LOC124279999 [Haliotis rubra]|uniref:uncharacterized protein LOC124279999 n=1 Tax=Haliotis rubra TaxID=36100 RepID=UPI001EE6198D|nr:uncharacterized protein LOC124279999 [Haliotis rubra]
MDQLTAGLGSVDNDGSHQRDVPALDLGTVLQRFSQSSQDGVLFQGLGDNLELEAGNSDKDSANVVSGNGGMSTDFTQTEGGSVQMRRSPVNMWSSEEGDSLSPVPSSVPQEQLYTRGTRVASKRSNLAVTPTVVWTNCEQSALIDDCKNTENTGEPSFVSKTGQKGENENSVNRDNSDSATKSRNDNPRSTIKYEVTINEDKTDISYNVEKTEYRTYGLKPKAVSGGQVENATAIIPDSININLTETKTFQTEDRYESVTKEKVLLQKGDGSGNRDTGVIVTEKLYESNHSLECEDVQRDSSVSRGSSVERQIVEEDFNSAAYVYEEDPMLGQTEHGAEGNVCSEYAIDSVHSPTSISEENVLTNKDSEGPGSYLSVVSNSQTLTGSGENCEIEREYSDGPCDISDDSLDAVSDSSRDQKTTLLPGSTGAHGITEGSPRDQSQLGTSGTDSHRELPQWQTETVQVGEIEPLDQNAEDVDLNLQDRSYSPWVVIGRASTEYIDDNYRVDAAPYSREPIVDLHLVEQNAVAPSTESTIHVQENKTSFPETIKQSFINSSSDKESLYFADGRGVLAGMNDMTLPYVSDDTFGRDGPMKSSNETEVKHRTASLQSLPSIGRGSATFLQDIPEDSSDDEQSKTKHVHECDWKNKTKDKESSVTGELSQEDSEKVPMSTSDLDTKGNVMGDRSHSRDHVNSQPQDDSLNSKSTEQNLPSSSDQSLDHTSLKFEKNSEEDKGMAELTTDLNRSSHESESVPLVRAGCHSSEVTQDTKMDGSGILSTDYPVKDDLEQSSVSIIPQLDVNVIQGKQLGSADRAAPESNVGIMQPSVNECSGNTSGEAVSVGEREVRTQIYSGVPTSPCQNTTEDNQVPGILLGTDPITDVPENDNPICGQSSTATKEIDIVVSDNRIIPDSLPDSSFSDLGVGHVPHEVIRECPAESSVTAQDQISSQHRQGHVLPDRTSTKMSDDLRDDTQTMDLYVSNDQRSRQQTVEKEADADREGIQRCSELIPNDDEKVPACVDPKELDNFKDDTQKIDTQTDAVHISDEDRKASGDGDLKQAEYREDTQAHAVLPSNDHRSEKKEAEALRENTQTASVPENADVGQKESGEYMEDIKTVDLYIAQDHRFGRKNLDQKISYADQEASSAPESDDVRQVEPKSADSLQEAQQTSSVQNIDGKIADALQKARKISSEADDSRQASRDVDQEESDDYREHTETVDIFVSDDERIGQQSRKMEPGTHQETTPVVHIHDSDDVRNVPSDVDQKEADAYREHTDTIDLFISDGQRLQQQNVDGNKADALHKAEETSFVTETDASRKASTDVDQEESDDYREHTETVDIFVSDDQRIGQQSSRMEPGTHQETTPAVHVHDSDDVKNAPLDVDQKEADDYREHTETVDTFVSDDQQQNVHGKTTDAPHKARETSSEPEADDSRQASTDINQEESNDYREHTETVDIFVSDDERIGQQSRKMEPGTHQETRPAVHVHGSDDVKNVPSDVDQKEADDYREHTETVDIFVSDDQRIRQLNDGKIADALHTVRDTSPVRETDADRKVSTDVDQKEADDYREHTETVDIFVSDDQQQNVHGKTTDAPHKARETSSVTEADDNTNAPTDVDQQESDDYREHTETVDIFVSDDERIGQQSRKMEPGTHQETRPAVHVHGSDDVKNVPSDVDQKEADDYREHTETVDIFVSDDQRIRQLNDGKIADALHTVRETFPVCETDADRKVSTDVDQKEADDYREHTETVDIFVSDDQQQNVHWKTTDAPHTARETSSVTEADDSRQASTDINQEDSNDYREHTETVDIFVSDDERIGQQSRKMEPVCETDADRKVSTDVDQKEADDYRKHTETVDIFVSDDQQQNVHGKTTDAPHTARETSSVTEADDNTNAPTDVDQQESDDYREHTETVDIFVSDDERIGQQSRKMEPVRDTSPVHETDADRKVSTDVDQKEADDYREHTETVDIFVSDDQQQNVHGKTTDAPHTARETSSVTEADDNTNAPTDVDQQESDDYREHTETVDIFLYRMMKELGNRMLTRRRLMITGNTQRLWIFLYLMIKEFSQLNDGKIADALHTVRETFPARETDADRKVSTDVDQKEADDNREHTETVDIFVSDDQQQNVHWKTTDAPHTARETSSVTEADDSRQASTDINQEDSNDYREHTETVDIFVSDDERIGQQSRKMEPGTHQETRPAVHVHGSDDVKNVPSDVDQKEADDYREHTETVDIFVLGDQRIRQQNDGKIADALHTAKETSSVCETDADRKVSTDVDQKEADDYREHTEKIDLFISADQRIRQQNVDGKAADALHTARETSSVLESDDSSNASRDVDQEESDDYREHTETIDLFISADQRIQQQNVHGKTTDALHTAREASSVPEADDSTNASRDVDQEESDDFREHTETVDIFVSGNQRIRQDNIHGKTTDALQTARETSVPETDNSRQASSDVDQEESDDYREHTETLDLFISDDQRIRQQNVHGKIADALHTARETSSVRETDASRKVSTDVDQKEADDYREHTETVDLFISADQRIRQQNVDEKAADALHTARETSVPETDASRQASSDVDQEESDDYREHTETVDLFISADQRIRQQNVDEKAADALHTARETSVPETDASRQASSDVDQEESDDYREHTETVDLFISDDQRIRQQNVHGKTTDALHTARETSSVHETDAGRKVSTDVDQKEADDYREHTETIDLFISADQRIRQQNVDEKAAEALKTARETSVPETDNSRQASSDVDQEESDDYREHTETLDLFISDDQRIRQQNVHGKIADALHTARETSSVRETDASRKVSTDVDQKEADDYREHTETIDLFISDDQRIRQQNVDKAADALHKAKETSSVLESDDSSNASSDVDQKESDDYREHTETIDLFISADQRIRQQNVHGKTTDALHTARESSSVPEADDSSNASRDVDQEESDDFREHTETVDIFVSGNQRIRQENVNEKTTDTPYKAKASSPVHETDDSRHMSTEFGQKEANDYREHTETVDIFVLGDQRIRQQNVDEKAADALHTARKTSSVPEADDSSNASRDVDQEESDDYREHTETIDLFISADQRIRQQNVDEKAAEALKTARETSVPETDNSRQASSDVDQEESDDYREHTETLDLFISDDQRIRQQNVHGKIADALNTAREKSSVRETDAGRKVSRDIDQKEADDYREHTETIDLFISDDQRIRQQNVDGKTADALHTARETSSVHETDAGRKVSTDVDQKEADDYREHTETIDLFISDDQRIRQQNVDKAADALHKARETSSVHETDAGRKVSRDVDQKEADDYREHTETIDLFISADQRIRQQNVHGKTTDALHTAREASSVPEADDSTNASRDVDQEESDDFREHTETVDIFVSGNQRIRQENVNEKTTDTPFRAKASSPVLGTDDSRHMSTDVDQKEDDDYREHTETVDIFVLGDQRIRQQNDGKIADAPHKARETSSVTESDDSTHAPTDVDQEESDDYREHTETVDIFVSDDQRIGQQSRKMEPGTHQETRPAVHVHGSDDVKNVPSDVDQKEADDYREHTETVDIFVSDDQRIRQLNDGKIADALNTARETSSVRETDAGRKVSTDVDQKEADDYREHTDTIDLFISADQRIQQQNVDEKAADALHTARETFSVLETDNSRQASSDVDQEESDDYREHTETVDIFVSDDQRIRQQNDGKIADALHTARETSSVNEIDASRKASKDVGQKEDDDYRESTEAVDIFVSDDQRNRQQNVDKKIDDALHKARETSSVPESDDSTKAPSDVDQEEDDDFREHTETVDIFVSGNQRIRQENVNEKTTDTPFRAKASSPVLGTDDSRHMSTDVDQKEDDDYREHTETVDIFVLGDQRIRQQNDGKIADAPHKARETSSVTESDDSTHAPTDVDQEESDDYREHTETVDIFVSDDQRIGQQSRKMEPGTHQETRPAVHVHGSDDVKNVPSDVDQKEADDYREHTETVDIFVSDDQRIRQLNDGKIADALNTARETSSVRETDAGRKVSTDVDQKEADDYREHTDTIDLFISADQRIQQQNVDEKAADALHTARETFSVLETDNSRQASSDVDQEESDDYREHTETVDIFVSDDQRIRQQNDGKIADALHTARETSSVNEIDASRKASKDVGQKEDDDYRESTEAVDIFVSDDQRNRQQNVDKKIDDALHKARETSSVPESDDSTKAPSDVDQEEDDDYMEDTETIDLFLSNYRKSWQQTAKKTPQSHQRDTVTVNEHGAENEHHGAGQVDSDDYREDTETVDLFISDDHRIQQQKVDEKEPETLLAHARNRECPVISGSEPSLSVHNAKTKEDRDILELVSNIDNIETETERKALRKEVKEEIKKLKYKDQSDSAISSDYTDLESSSPRSSQSKEQDSPKHIYQQQVQIGQTFHQTMPHRDFLKLVAKDEEQERASLKDSGNVYDADEVDQPQGESYLWELKQTRNKADVKVLQAVETGMTIQTHTEDSHQGDMEGDSHSLSNIDVLERQSSSIRNVHDRESSVTNQGGYAMSKQRPLSMSNIADQELPNQSFTHKSLTPAPQLDDIGSVGEVKANDDAAQLLMASEHLPKYLGSETVQRSLPASIEAVDKYKQSEEKNESVIPDDRDGSHNTNSHDLEGFTNQHAPAEDRDNSYTFSSHYQPATVDPSISNRITISHRHEADWQTEKSPEKREVMVHSSHAAAGYDSQGLPKAPSADIVDKYTSYEGQHVDSVDRTMQASESVVLELKTPSMAEKSSRQISEIYGKQSHEGVNHHTNYPQTMDSLEGGLPILSEAHTQLTSSAQTDSEIFLPRDEEVMTMVWDKRFNHVLRSSTMFSEGDRQLTRSAQTDSEFFISSDDNGDGRAPQSTVQDASVSADFTHYDSVTRGSTMFSEVDRQLTRSAQTDSEFFISSDDNGDVRVPQSTVQDASVSADFTHYDSVTRGSTMFSEVDRQQTRSAQTDSEFFISSDDNGDGRVPQSAVQDASVSADFTDYDSVTRGSTMFSEVDSQLSRSAQTDSELFVSSNDNGDGRVPQSAVQDVSVSTDFTDYDSVTRGSNMFSEADSKLSRSAQTDSEIFLSWDEEGDGKVQQSKMQDASVSADFTDYDSVTRGSTMFSEVDSQLSRSAQTDSEWFVSSDDDGDGKVQQSAVQDVSVSADLTDYVGVGVQTDDKQESSFTEMIPHLKQFPHTVTKDSIRNQHNEHQSVETQQNREHAIPDLSSTSVWAQTKEDDSQKEKSFETRTSVQTESDIYGTDRFGSSEYRISLNKKSESDIANVSSSGPVYHHEVTSSVSRSLKLTEASNLDPSLQTNPGSYTDEESPQDHVSDRTSIRNIQSDALSLPPVLTSVGKDIDGLRREHSRMMELLERSREKSTTLSPKSKGSPPSSSSSSMSPVTVIEQGGSNNGSLEGSPPETQRDRPAHTDQQDSQLNREEILKSLEVEDLTLRIGTATEQACKSPSNSFEHENQKEGFLPSSDSADQNFDTTTLMSKNKSSEKDSEDKQSNMTESKTMSASMCETTQTTEPVSVNDCSQTPHPRASATQTSHRFDYVNNLSPPQIHININDEDVVEDILSDNSTTPCMSPSTVPEIIDDNSYVSPSGNPSHTMTRSSRRYVSTGVEACVDSSDEFTQTDYEDSTLDSSFSSDKYRQTSVKSTSTDSVRIQSELERLERERIEIIELLSLNYLPSSLTVELLEAKMNYCIGQTDMLLASLEDSWDKEYTELTSSNAGLSRVTKEYVSNYRQQFKESRREMAAAIETKQRLKSRGRGRRKARNSDILKMKRRAEIESFKLERLREQEMHQRTRSYSPLKQYVPAATGRGRSSPGSEQSSQEFKYMTPKQRKKHLVSLRKKIVAESEDELHHLRSRSVSPISDYYLTESRYSLNSSRESSFSPDRTLSPQMYNHHGYSTHGTNESRDIYMESMYRPHSTGSIYNHYSVDRPPSRSVSAAQIMSNGVDPDQMIQETAIIRQLNQRQILEAQSSLRQLEARQRLMSMPMTSFLFCIECTTES